MVSLQDSTFDFERIVPPGIFLLAHNTLTQIRVNMDPTEIYRHFLISTVYETGDTEYPVSHLIGSEYQLQAGPSLHIQWLNQMIHGFYNPVVSRAHLQRPSLMPLNYMPPHYPLDHVDPYSLLTGYNYPMLNTTYKLIENVSQYLFTAGLTNNQKLAQTMNEGNEFTLLTHSIEPTTMPTWHRLEKPALVAARPNIVTASQHATYCHFLAVPQTFRSSKTLPAVDYDPDLLLLHDGAYNPDEPPVIPMAFNERIHTSPDVLWFSPYNKSTTRILFAGLLGLNIEQSNIDCVTIPIENPKQHLIDINSVYRCGLIPTTHIEAPLQNSSNHHSSEK